MVPRAEIIAWRQVAPWADDDDVEQDLLITRAIFDIFADPSLAEKLAFRGGTALHKLYLAPAARYSDDIDLVQRLPEPIGPTFDRLRSVLSWLSRPRSDIGEIPKLYFRFVTESGAVRRNLKVEINTHEHFAETVEFDFVLERSVTLPTHTVNELLATKLRALIQRDKGRDLFDFWWAGKHIALDPDVIVSRFAVYMERGGDVVPSAPELRNTLERKSQAGVFEEVTPLLRAGVAFDVAEALEWFEAMFVARLRNDDGTRSFERP